MLVRIIQFHYNKYKEKLLEKSEEILFFCLILHFSPAVVPDFEERSPAYLLRVIVYESPHPFQGSRKPSTVCLHSFPRQPGVELTEIAGPHDFLQQPSASSFRRTHRHVFSFQSEYRFQYPHHLRRKIRHLQCAPLPGRPCPFLRACFLSEYIEDVHQLP